MKVLITGGAGFIGSHLTDRLIRAGARVRILDSLEQQVHGLGGGGGGRPPLAASDENRPGGGWGGDPPEYLNPAAELIVGDVCDKRAVLEALDSVDAVFHLAARVGVGQSMYEIVDYCRANALGTAVLLEALVDRPVKRLIVASSMSIYGEGRYAAPDGRVIEPPDRRRQQLERRDWELRSSRGEPLRPIPTPEDKKPALTSVYALSKYDQERLCLMFGDAYRIPTVALRFFNVYGTRQALSNPYTGVLAIFASRLLNGRPPVIFEDGLQRRDFVSVHDIVSACSLALESDRAPGQAINIGSGRSMTIREVAEKLSSVLANGHTPSSDLAPQIAGTYRAGDIRHCFADITAARELLGYQPSVAFEDGIAELAEWLKGQRAVDNVDAAANELSSRGLTL